MTKDHLAIPDFANNGMIQSVPLDPLLRNLTVVVFYKFVHQNYLTDFQLHYAIISVFARALVYLF